jgi:Mn-dependent DtxR family transcriptional regulator
VEASVLKRQFERIPALQRLLLRYAQALIAQMLGVRRVGVTQAAGRLQAAGLIDYRRGRITVLDRRGLEESACECYATVRNEYARLLTAVPSRPFTLAG